MTDRRVIIKTFDSEVEAEVARDYLRSAGIEADLQPPPEPEHTRAPVDRRSLAIPGRVQGQAEDLLREMEPPGELSGDDEVIVPTGGAYLKLGIVLLVVGVALLIAPIPPYIGGVLLLASVILIKYGLFTQRRSRRKRVEP